MTPWSRILQEAGIRDESVSPVIPQPKPAGSVREAVQRAIPSLQRCDVAFLDRAGCVSCHNNSLTAMMVAEARSRGFRVNEEIASSQLRRIAAFLQENSERGLENEGIPGGIDTVSYILLGMATEKYPSDTITDVWARYARSTQSSDGRFKCRTVRPPLETSDFQVTAVTIRSLLAYAPKSQRPEYKRAADRAIRWLETAEPASTEDHVFQILGLKWGGGSSESDPQGRLTTPEAATLRRRMGADSPIAVGCICKRPGYGGAAGIRHNGPCRGTISAWCAIPCQLPDGRRVMAGKNSISILPAVL